MKRFQALDSGVVTLMEEARKVDTIEDFGDRREALEAFRDRLGEMMKKLAPESWQDSAEELAEDVARFQQSRKESDNEYLEKGVKVISRPDQMIARIGTRDTAFMALKHVVSQVRFTLGELKKLEAQFEKLIGRLETLESGAKDVKHHEAQSHVAQCLMTEAHGALGQIKCIAQGISIFPTHFAEAHSALGKMQKHVLAIYGSTVDAMEDSDDFDMDLIRTQYGKLEAAHSRFTAIRRG